MSKIFFNKFFVLFVAISFFFYFGFVHVSYAGGGNPFRAIQNIFTAVLIVVFAVTPGLQPFLPGLISTIATATFVGLVANFIFPCNPLIGFVASSIAGGGSPVNTAGELTGNSSGFSAGGGDGCDSGGNPPPSSGGGGYKGTPGSPLLSGYSTNPIKSNGYCTTGFALSFDVSDAYQYGIYRDGNLINQGKVQDYPGGSASGSCRDSNDNPVTCNCGVDDNGNYTRYCPPNDNNSD